MLQFSAIVSSPLTHYKYIPALPLIFIVVSREWEKEVYKAEQQGKDPSFLWAIVRSFGLGYSLLGLVAFMHVSKVFSFDHRQKYLGIAVNIESPTKVLFSELLSPGIYRY